MSVRTRRPRGLIALLVVSVVSISLVACSKDDEEGLKAPPETAQVTAGSAATVASTDGKVTVHLPEGATSGTGQLSVREAADPTGQAGWQIELTGARLTGEAELRFARPRQKEGEPDPLVFWATKPGAAPALAPSTVDDDEIVVRTQHFSFWFLPDWKDIAKNTMSWAGAKLDSLFSLGSQGKHPRCSEESAVRSSGYEVASDKGKRVYWCIGREKGRVVLKAVNARGYGVAVEYTPGLTVSSLDTADLVGQIAKLFPTAPSKRGNKMLLLPSADQVVFSAPRSGAAAARFTPDSGAYLVAALGFAVETIDMLGGKLGSKGLGGKVVKGLKDGAQCLGTLTEMMTNDLGSATDAIKFFKAAISASFDCVADVVDDIDLGVINNVIVAPLLWLIDGVYTAVNGVVAAVEAFDMDGYQILVTAPAVTGPVTQKVVIDPFTETWLKPGWRLDSSTWTGSPPMDCTYDSGSPYALGPGTHSCGSTADAANACWWSPARTDQLWCLDALDPSSRTLTVRNAENVRVTPAPKSPEPLFLELSDGSVWWARTGGAWGSRADGYEPMYGCVNKKGACGKDWYVLSKGSTVDTALPTWTVHVGPVGEPRDTFPTPQEIAVRKAWFLAGKTWKGH